MNQNELIKKVFVRCPESSLVMKRKKGIAPLRHQHVARSKDNLACLHVKLFLARTQFRKMNMVPLLNKQSIDEGTLDGDIKP